MIIGIDLGTTKSAIGFWKDDKPHIIPDKSGHDTSPPLVLVTPKNRIYVERDAINHPKRYNGKNITIDSVKRLMGRSGRNTWGPLETYAQEISAFILKDLKLRAEEYLNQEIKEVIIAIPSHFDENQRSATKEAAEIARLKVIRLLNEATASAINYNFQTSEEGYFMIFDLGGGTLDISIVEISEEIIEVVYIIGDSNLGGNDFDKLIYDYLILEIKKEFGPRIKINEIFKNRLMEISERVKIDLSSKYEIDIHLAGFNINDNCKIDFKKRKLKLPKIKIWINYKDDREFDEEIKHITVSRIRSGKYYASILVEIESNIEPMKKLNENKIVAFDMSATDFLITERFKLTNPRFYRTENHKLRKYHKE
ncbi:MAG: Hsp70 family protein, partial [Candidatus Lokiarchaeota archaeon]|nr:Hsp70 family protein [Candidatus Lokiarchaeota archaeon]